MSTDSITGSTSFLHEGHGAGGGGHDRKVHRNWEIDTHVSLKLNYFSA